MAETKTGRESDKFMLRLPDGMRDRLAEAAKANGRSMNAEIVLRLERSFDAKPGRAEKREWQELAAQIDFEQLIRTMEKLQKRLSKAEGN